MNLKKKYKDIEWSKIAGNFDKWEKNIKQIFNNKGACILDSEVKAPLEQGSDETKKLFMRKDTKGDTKTADPKSVIELSWDKKNKKSNRFYANQIIHMNAINFEDKALHFKFPLKPEWQENRWKGVDNDKAHNLFNNYLFHDKQR